MGVPLEVLDCLGAIVTSSCGYGVTAVACCSSRPAWARRGSAIVFLAVFLPQLAYLEPLAVPCLTLTPAISSDDEDGQGYSHDDKRRKQGGKNNLTDHH